MIGSREDAKARRFGHLLCIAAMVSGCGSNASNTTTQKPVEGWQSLKFGSTIEEAMSAFPSVRWNPVSISECYQEMAIQGCGLFPDRENSLTALEDGIMFLPSLKFDKFGKLTSISMEYRTEGNISSEQCEDILQRSVDNAVKKFGSVKWPKPVDSDQAGASMAKTTAGNDYPMWRSKDGSFVGGPMRTHWLGYRNDDSRPITEWNSIAHIWILSSFILVDRKPYCSVSVVHQSGKR